LPITSICKLTFLNINKIFSFTSYSVCNTALISISSRYITMLFDIVTELSNQAYSPVDLLFLQTGASDEFLSASLKIVISVR
jgi:hypothetical protein